MMKVTIQLPPPPPEPEVVIHMTMAEAKELLKAVCSLGHGWRYKRVTDALSDALHAAGVRPK